MWLPRIFPQALRFFSLIKMNSQSITSGCGQIPSIGVTSGILPFHWSDWIKLVLLLVLLHVLIIMIIMTAMVVMMMMMMMVVIIIILIETVLNFYRKATNCQWERGVSVINCSDRSEEKQEFSTRLERCQQAAIRYARYYAFIIAPGVGPFDFLNDNVVWLDTTWKRCQLDL